LAEIEELELADEAGNVIPVAELFAQTIKTLNLMGIKNQNSILQQRNIFTNLASDILNIEVIKTQKVSLNMELMDMLGRVKTRKEMGGLIPGVSTFHFITANLLNGVYSIKLDLDGENSKNRYLNTVVNSR